MPLYQSPNKRNAKGGLSLTKLKPGDLITIFLGRPSSISIRREGINLVHRFSTTSPPDLFYRLSMCSRDDAINLLELITDAAGLGFRENSFSGEQIAFDILAAKSRSI